MAYNIDNRIARSYSYDHSQTHRSNKRNNRCSNVRDHEAHHSKSKSHRSHTNHKHKRSRSSRLPIDPSSVEWCRYDMDGGCRHDVDKCRYPHGSTFLDYLSSKFAMDQQCIKKQCIDTIGKMMCSNKNIGSDTYKTAIGACFKLADLGNAIANDKSDLMKSNRIRMRSDTNDNIPMTDLTNNSRSPSLSFSNTGYN
eukprot:183119_1